MTIRVLIADDHPLVREGLRYTLERSGKGIVVVGEASDGHTVVQMAETRPVDVFILDITMPRLNGLDAAHALRRRHPNAKIIMLSLHDTRAFVEQAMAVGARGYVTKDTASSCVAEAVCEVNAGNFYLSPDITHYMVDRGGGATQGERPAMPALTAQERQVLQLIAEGETAKEIAADLGCSVNTIQAHRKNLMAKLNLHKQTHLVRFALKEGIAKL